MQHAICIRGARAAGTAMETVLDGIDNRGVPVSQTVACTSRNTSGLPELRSNSNNTRAVEAQFGTAMDAVLREMGSRVTCTVGTIAGVSPDTGRDVGGLGRLVRITTGHNNLNLHFSRCNLG